MNKYKEVKQDTIDDKQNKKKGKRILIILLLLFVFGVSLFLVYYSQNQNIYKDRDAQIGIMPGMSEEEVQERLNTVVSEGMMNVTINPRPIFSNGSSKGTLRIENIKQNHYSYLVSIMLDETQEVVYESGLLEPGYFIETAKLNKKLKKGEYQATARFMAYQDVKDKAIGSAVVKIIIVIEN